MVIVLFVRCIGNFVYCQVACSTCLLFASFFVSWGPVHAFGMWRILHDLLLFNFLCVVFFLFFAY